MIGEMLYIVIGFIMAVIIVSVISYYDEGDNDFDAYASAGLVGVIIVMAWPVIAPLAMFAALAWYISENMGRNS